MSDTDAAIRLRLAELHRRMTPAQRMQIASGLFDTARAIVASSLPSHLTSHEKRLALARRFYGGELPESALVEFAGYRDPKTL